MRRLAWDDYFRYSTAGEKVFYTDTNGLKPYFRSTALVLLEMAMEKSLFDLDFEKFNEAVKDADEFLLEDES